MDPGSGDVGSPPLPEPSLSFGHGFSPFCLMGVGWRWDTVGGGDGCPWEGTLSLLVSGCGGYIPRIGFVSSFSPSPDLVDVGRGVRTGDPGESGSLPRS